MAKKFIIPNFVEIFGDVRGDPTKHLNQKVREGGEYLVPDDVIAQFAKTILASEFYCEPWLTGCAPETVLFEGVIRDLGSEVKTCVRKAVNAVYGAETRVLVMGVEAYIEWRRAGMPAKALGKKPGESSKGVTQKHPSKQSVPLPALKADTANKLNGFLSKQRLLDEMPDSLREKLAGVQEAMAKGLLLQPTGEAILLAVEQWLLLRKEQRAEAANQAALAQVITPALQQYDYFLNTFAGDERVTEHLTHLRDVLESANAKSIASAIKAGDQLSGLLDGTIAPVVSISTTQDNKPYAQLADADYVRARLGHFMTPERGRPVAGAGKGQKEKSRKSG